MSKGKKKEKRGRQGTKRLRQRIFYSILVCLIYRLGQYIPLPFTGGLVWGERDLTGFYPFIQSILGTSLQEASLLSLGLMPSMTAAIIVQMLSLSSTRPSSRISNEEKNRRIRALAFFISVIYAFVKVRGLELVGTDDLSTLEVQVLTGIGLTAGAMFVMWLGERNTQRGLGGVSLLVAVNIVSGIAQNILRGEYMPEPGEGYYRIGIMAGYCVLIVLLCVFMEYSELRLPVLRVMIDSPMSGDSVLAIRLNPVGTIPVMYCMAFFTLPLYLIGFVRIFLPDNVFLAYLTSVLNLSNPIGLLVFLALFLIMTLGLAGLYINPVEIAEDLKRAGDYIEGVHPGRETLGYVRRRLIRLSVVSWFVMGVAIGAPILYAGLQEHAANIYYLPMTIAILSGIWLGILSEGRVLYTFDSYRPRL